MDPYRNNDAFLLSSGESVQATADYAVTSLQSAINSGYLENPFAKTFLKKNKIKKLSPVSNRGYVSLSLLVWAANDEIKIFLYLLPYPKTKSYLFYLSKS